MHVYYFAFGSNMCSRRLRARLPRALSLGRGRLDDWIFVCNKTGNDGSAKANIVRREGHVVWGVVFSISESDLSKLDRFEGGYQRFQVEVTASDATLTCETYASDRVDDGLEPFGWYKQHMLDGAQEHDLPGEHVAMLNALSTRPNQARR